MQKRTHKSFRVDYLPIEVSDDFPVYIRSKEKYKLGDWDISVLHFHNNLELGYCYDGGGIFLIDGEIHPFSKGDISIIFANHVHIAQSEKDTTSLWNFINIDQEKLLSFLTLQELSLISVLSNTDNGFSRVFSHRRYEKLSNIVLNIISEIIEEKPNYQAAVRSLVWQLFIELDRIKERESTNKEFVKSETQMRLSPALEYIAKNYSSKIYVSELASLCNTDVRNFRRMFKKAFRLSPSAYITKFRIEMSGVLLRSSDYSILEIGEKCGFETLSSFNRCFKRIMGVTPREWRKSRRVT